MKIDFIVAVETRERRSPIKILVAQIGIAILYPCAKSVGECIFHTTTYRVAEISLVVLFSNLTGEE